MNSSPWKETILNRKGSSSKHHFLGDMLVWGRITCRYFFTWGKVDFWWNHNFVFGIFPESVSFLKQEWVSELRCASCSFGGSINSCISWNWVLLRFHLYIYVDFMGANQFFSPNKTSFISISCNPNCKRNILQLFRISNSAGWFFGDFDLADAIIDISGWIQRFGSKKNMWAMKKTRSYFPLNPGCLIGILIMACLIIPT